MTNQKDNNTYTNFNPTLNVVTKTKTVHYPLFHTNFHTTKNKDNTTTHPTQNLSDKETNVTHTISDINVQPTHNNLETPIDIEDKENHLILDPKRSTRPHRTSHHLSNFDCNNSKRCNLVSFSP